jgi:putative flippase GtrA
MSRTSSSLPRQSVLFLLVGLAQLVVDTAIYIGLTALGMPVTPANIAGRVGGVSLGFALNARYTFAVDGQSHMGRRTMFRFLVMWLALTALSTLILAQVAGSAGLQGSWLAKPAVEAVMAAIGFIIQRHWVFRPRM